MPLSLDNQEKKTDSKALYKIAWEMLGKVIEEKQKMR